eukprot:UN31143
MGPWVKMISGPWMGFKGKLYEKTVSNLVGREYNVQIGCCNVKCKRECLEILKKRPTITKTNAFIVLIDLHVTKLVPDWNRRCSIELTHSICGTIVLEDLENRALVQTTISEELLELAWKEAEMPEIEGGFATFRHLLGEEAIVEEIDEDDYTVNLSFKRMCRNHWWPVGALE